MNPTYKLFIGEFAYERRKLQTLTDARQQRCEFAVKDPNIITDIQIINRNKYERGTI